MSRFVLFFVAVALFLPNLIVAKRFAPEKVEPVIYKGIRYIAPNDDGRRIRLSARHLAAHRSGHEASGVTPRPPGRARARRTRPWWTGRARRDARAVPRGVDPGIAHTQAGADGPKIARRHRQCLLR